tara:strand:- start:180 stop:1847 length:1668 start_codon:yes stop_codon:yes gene_type:complete
MAEDSLLKFIFPKADPKGIQSGLNFVFPKANFDFAGEDTEEIIDDNEIIRPPLSKKTGGIDLNLIPDEIQEKLNLLTNTPIVKKKDETTKNVVTSGDEDENVDVNDSADDSEQSLTPTMEGFEEFTELQKDSFRPDLEGVDKYREASQDLFDKSLSNYENVFKGSIPKIGKVEDYKQEFYEATGLDPSGKPDLRTAATAFGLALMQNKAGKGFNIGRIMAEIGKAGEKALPLAEKARQQAKAEEIAAGRFALGEVGKDKVAAQTAIQNKIKAITELQKEFRGYENDAQKAILNAYYEQQKVRLENRGKILAEREKNAGKPGAQFEFSAEQKLPLIAGMNDKILHVANRKIDGSEVFTKPTTDVNGFAQGYGDTLEAIGSLDLIEDEIRKIAKGSLAFAVVKQRVDSFLTGTFGRKYSLSFDPDTGKRTTPVADIDAIQKRLIAQYKRFLTQETGNGISNVDVERLVEALGKINLFTDPDKAIKQIRETKKIFEARKKTFSNVLSDFQDRSKYFSDKAYIETTSKIDKLIADEIGTDFVKPIGVSDDGIKLYTTLG